MSHIKSFLGLLIVSVALLALSANVAAADPVMVLNNGQGTSNCAFEAFGGWYAGVTSTVVLNNDGTVKLSRCSAELVKGQPVSSTMEYWNGDLHVVINPSGRANVSYNP
jgi:hypothetical protein